MSFYILTLALILFEILTFQIFDLHKGHGLQFSQCCPSMANIKIYNSRLTFLAIALTVSEILTFSMFDIQK